MQVLDGSKMEDVTKSLLLLSLSRNLPLSSALDLGGRGGLVLGNRHTWSPEAGHVDGDMSRLSSSDDIHRNVATERHRADGATPVRKGVDFDAVERNHILASM